MDRLTPAARAYLVELRLDEDRARHVLECATAMACAEIEPVHIQLGVVIEGARQEAVTSAA
jgi:succinate dehydrogenase/fumarate reductase-like Fe-S protein